MNSSSQFDLTTLGLSCDNVSRARAVGNEVELGAERDPRVLTRSSESPLAWAQYSLGHLKLRARFPTGGVVLVTSPSTGDGKTLTTLNLASVISSTKESVLVIEADPHNPTINLKLGVPPSHDFERILDGDQPPGSFDRMLPAEGFHFISFSGPQGDAGVGVVSGSTFAPLLKWARTEFKWILLDAPPVYPVPEVSELAPLADIVLFVVGIRQSESTLVEKSLQALSGSLCGVVVNFADEASDSIYQSYNGKYRKYPYDGSKPRH